MTTRDELIIWGHRNGWALDRWGHLKKGERRLKLSRIAARMEIKFPSGWVRLGSGYYKDISIDRADDTLRGFRG